jgi:hypothetical protein
MINLVCCDEPSHLPAATPSIMKTFRTKTMGYKCHGNGIKKANKRQLSGETAINVFG